MKLGGATVPLLRVGDGSQREHYSCAIAVVENTLIVCLFATTSSSTRNGDMSSAVTTLSIKITRMSIK